MQTEDLISVDEFCSSHQIELSFVSTLEEYGLVETVTQEKKVYLQVNELSRLEQVLRLHRELNVNFEGIDAINHLLAQIEQMQAEIAWLRNRLNFYEENG